MTKAAVMAWQAGHGLVADGVVGAMTRAALMGAPTGNFPAGCTSASGYSSTTGVKCDTGTSMGLPAGCSSTAGYSPLTGAKCDGGSSSSSNNGPLSGGAGDIIVTNTTADTETDISEGTTEKVLAFRIEADGSDVEVNNVKVVFDNSGTTGSTRLNRYISQVDVWMGSEKVGSADVEEFTKDGALYTKNITLSDAVVRMGSGNRETFYVSVKALSNIDSNDLLNDSWSIDTDGIRFTDSTGVVLTDTFNVTAANLDFTDLATSGDVKVKVTKSSGSPVAQNVEVSDTGSTSDVTMLTFTVKAEGTDVTFDSMDFDVEAVGADANLITSELALYAGSTRIGDISTVTDVDGGGATSNTIDLFDDYTIDAGDTVTFTVKAKVKEIGTGGFAQGDSLTVSFDAFGGVLEDTNGDTVTNVTGSAIGEAQTFFSEGINVSNFSSSATATTDQNGKLTKQTYSVSFKVTAFGNTYYLPKTIVRDSGASDGLVYTVETSAGATSTAAADVVASSASSLSSSAATVGGYYEIADGDSETFTATIALDNSGANFVNGFYRVQLEDVRYDTDQAGVPSSYTLAPSQDYETADKQLTI
jgi:hypothetical protein